MRSNLAEIHPFKDGPIDKDGDGNEEDPIQSVHIDFAINGYTVVYTYESGEEVKYVFVDFNEVLTHLRSSH